MPDFDNIMEFPDLIKRLNELTTNINKKQTEIENLLKEKLLLLDKISEKKQKNIKNSILINDLKNKYKDLEKKYKNLQNENMNLENKNKILQNENKNLQNEKMNLENKNKNLQNENKNLQNEKMNLQNENMNLQNENKNQGNENNNLKKELNFYKEKIKNNESEKNQFKVKAMEFESKVEISEKKILILNELNAKLNLKANNYYYENLRNIKLSGKLSIMNENLIKILKENNLEEEIKKLK